MQDIRIGQNIAALRKNSRITQEQLAQALHISAQAVSKWECGICLPDTITIPQIAEYFHVSIDFLYYGKAEPMQSEKKAVNREKNHYANRLLYRTFKEEELAALTDEEFAQLQEKLDNYLTFSPGYNVNFEDFYHGTNAEDISGNGSGTDFRIYRRKAFLSTENRYFDCWIRACFYPSFVALAEIPPYLLFEGTYPCKPHRHICKFQCIFQVSKS